jgi:hypothetical protein
MAEKRRRSRDELERESQLEGAPSREEDPHHPLSNPVDDPDATEYPDPYESRPDPRGPDEREEDDAPPGPSTSEPPPPHRYDELKPVKGDKEGG